MTPDRKRHMFSVGNGRISSLTKEEKYRIPLSLIQELMN
jgi:hypothetical protein